jgi:cytochrome P450
MNAPEPPVSVARSAPGPTGLALFHVLKDLKSRPLEVLEELHQKYGDVVTMSAGHPVFLVVHPDGVKHVLQDNHLNYRKGFDYQRMEPLLGRGLLTTNGEEWKRHRRIAQPSFHRQRVASFGALMVRHTRRALERWKALGDGAELELHGEMMRLTLEIVCEALFSVDLEKGGVKADGIAAAMESTLRTINERVNDLIALPMWLPTPTHLEFKRQRRVIDELVTGIIRERRGAPPADDLLSMLMEARDEEGPSLDDGELRDEVMTMVLAGHETTANALAFTFMLLSRHPEVRGLLEGSVQGALGDREAAAGDVPALQYTRQVVEESMRLYPPAWALSRQAVDEDTVLGYRVPKGALVSVVQWLTHRDPRFWPEPEKFDPTRFEPGAAAARHRFASFPFGAGPRLCIGQAFAMMELQLILATLVREVRFEVLQPEKVELEPLITLRGLPARLRFIR